jgi:hypothetical protein
VSTTPELFDEPAGRDPNAPWGGLPPEPWLPPAERVAADQPAQAPEAVADDSAPTTDGSGETQLASLEAQLADVRAQLAAIEDRRRRDVGRLDGLLWAHGRELAALAGAVLELKSQVERLAEVAETERGRTASTPADLLGQLEQQLREAEGRLAHRSPTPASPPEPPPRESS